MAITLMYAISGFFSILVDAFDLRYWDSVGYEISAKASLAYCALLTMCLYPLIRYPNVKIRRFKPLPNPEIIKVIALVSLLWFVASLVFGWERLIRVLTGNMADIRADIYLAKSENDWMLSLPNPIRLIISAFNLLFGCSWVFIFFAFYSIYVQKLPARYFYIFIFSSLSGPFAGIVGADRSKTAYWIIALVGIYLLFKTYLTEKERKKIIRVGIVLIGLLTAYLAAMTISRFGQRDYGGDVSGTQGGLILYLGQSYINFCYFFDNYKPPFIHMGIIFPFISNYILGIPSGGTEIQNTMNMLTGYHTNVFYTFLGQILIAAGKDVAIMYAITYTILSLFILKRITRKRSASITQGYLYFAISSVPLLGLFVHYYASSNLTFSLVFFFIILTLSSLSGR